jgi:hypothetical protein
MKTYGYVWNKLFFDFQNTQKNLKCNKSFCYLKKNLKDLRIFENEIVLEKI